MTALPIKTILLLLLFSVLPLSAAERILSYNSEIRVGRDGWLDVTETIEVYVEGINIRRGIYRDFPQTYKTKWGLRQVRPFEISEVTRNGIVEPFLLAKMGSGTRVWIGDRGTFLPYGTKQEYTLKYRTGGQLFYDDKGDELYWNATGNHWIFPIDKATTKIILPEGIDVLTAEAYTGPQGAKARQYEASTNGSTATFTTTSGLARLEGLTVVVRWEKGKLDPAAYLPRSILADNLFLFIGLLLVTCGLVAFGIFWNMVGKDPARGVIIPRWEPPQDMSPAGVRFVKRMGFDNVCFSSAVIGLAAKGGATIKELNKNFFDLIRKENGENLLSEEEQLSEDLFGSTTRITLDQVNHVRIGKARSNLQESLTSAYQNSFFKINSMMWWNAVLACVVGLALIALQADFLIPTLIPMLALCLGTVLLVHAVKTAFERFQSGKKLFVITWTTFAVILFAGLVFGLSIVSNRGGAILALSMAIFLIFAAIFRHLLKAPSKAGRKTLDEIDGFHQYLSVAEEDRLNLENPPEKTPELFEKLLPYALALGVEQKWSEKFTDILSEIHESGTQSSYTPSFYSGNSGNFGNVLGGAAFASALTGALASSATPPSSSGSSSGGGGGGGGFSVGGGFSGGGGGGGGGGGW